MLLGLQDSLQHIHMPSNQDSLYPNWLYMQTIDPEQLLPALIGLQGSTVKTYCTAYIMAHHDHYHLTLPLLHRPTTL